MDLLDRAGDTEEDSWIKIAFNEILSTIYINAMSTKELDKIVDDMGLILKNKLAIKDDNQLDWQKIEAWHNKYSRSLTMVLNFNEITNIISKSKITSEYEWEDIKSKEIPIEKINKDFLEYFQEELNPHILDPKHFLIEEKIPNELTLQSMENINNNLSETISFQELKNEMKEKITGNERDYRNEMSPIKDATHQNFKFDIYKINEFEEWKKIKTVELINYSKKYSGGGSGGGEIFHKKNGKKLDLLTIETYDLVMHPEKYGTYVEDKAIFLKRNYITLETLNTIYRIADKNHWEFF